MTIKLFNENVTREVCIELNRSKTANVSESAGETIIAEYCLELTNDLKNELKECETVEEYNDFLYNYEISKVKE